MKKPFDLADQNAVESLFRSASVALTQAIIDALSISQAAKGIPSTTQSRTYWASVLFARLCAFAGSLHQLIPGSAANAAGTVYDFGSVAALSRCVLEAYLTMFYLCDNTLSDVDFQLRLRLVQLHDCSRRPEILKKLTGSVDDDWFAAQAHELRSDIAANSVFQALDSRKKTELLKGKTPYYLSQDELIAKLQGEVKEIRGLYEFLSSYVHTFPFSFMRIPSQGDRNTGKENIVDKGYIAIATELTTAVVERATQDMRKVFPDLKAIPRCTVEWATLLCRPITGGNFVFGMQNPRA